MFFDIEKCFARILIKINLGFVENRDDLFVTKSWRTRKNELIKLQTVIYPK